MDEIHLLKTTWPDIAELKDFPGINPNYFMHVLSTGLWPFLTPILQDPFALRRREIDLYHYALKLNAPSRRVSRHHYAANAN